MFSIFDSNTLLHKDTENVFLSSLLYFSLRTSQESELRKRNFPAPQHPADGANQLDGHMGIQDDTSKAPTTFHQQHLTKEEELPEAEEEQKIEDFPEPGTWSPLLANVCLYTALALSAYVCYRAYFH